MIYIEIEQLDSFDMTTLLRKLIISKNVWLLNLC